MGGTLTQVELIGVVAIALAMAIGLAGTIVPFVPGTSLIWAAALVYGLLAGFTRAGWIAFSAITVLLVAGTVVKVVLPHRRGKAGGAPTRSLLIGAAAGIAGFFVIPVVGLALGAVAGVLVAEYARTRAWPSAWRSTKGVIVGIGLGALAELGVGMGMVLCWVAWVLAER
jgi:uncharacterized protein YqgC (DUF456 family)